MLNTFNHIGGMDAVEVPDIKAVESAILSSCSDQLLVIVTG